MCSESTHIFLPLLTALSCRALPLLAWLSWLFPTCPFLLSRAAANAIFTNQPEFSLEHGIRIHHYSCELLLYFLIPRKIKFQSPGLWTFAIIGTLCPAHSHSPWPLWTPLALDSIITQTNGFSLFCEEWACCQEGLLTFHPLCLILYSPYRVSFHDFES